jgi:hypothetical protein
MQRRPVQVVPLFRKRNQPQATAMPPVKRLVEEKALCRRGKACGPPAQACSF